MAESKYGKYIYKHPIESLGKLSSGMDRAYVGFERKEDFDSNITVIYLYAREPDPPVETHTHDYDEYLSFIGLDPDNPGYLGAECPILLGEEQEDPGTPARGSGERRREGEPRLDLDPTAAR